MKRLNSLSKKSFHFRKNQLLFIICHQNSMEFFHRCKSLLYLFQ
ncbi:hypothetical protein [Tepidibacillus sp. LV47]